MRLERDDVQRDLVRAVRADLDPLVGPGGRMDPAEVHAALADLDLFALELPDAMGGLAFGLSCAAPVCEELGRSAAPDSYRAHALLAELAQATEGEGPGHRSSALNAVLPLLGAGKVTADLAAGTGVLAASTSEGWRLDGECTLSESLPDAAFHLVPAQTTEGTVLAAVSADSPGSVLSGTRREGIRRLALTGVAAHALSAPLHDTGGLPSPLLARARLRQAAYLLGLASGAHRLAVRRAAARHQFGRPVAENQAVAFPLAEQFAHMEAARLLTHEAAWDADGGGPATVGATQSLAYAAELALQVTAHAVHVHGAAGITGDFAVQRHYRVAAVEATRWGAPAELTEILVDLLGVDTVD
ncbi:acyl-CoA dehydrogenase family protein, partial [Streptomyces sp. NPDC058469]|uniref:acyl-CoA dehydrogenase family protein n=1 Tax=Streptomyces sp. NPDC058469 TaxID=3346514 RepID=UPI003667DC91